MSDKLSAEQVTYRTHRIAAWSGGALLAALIVHAALLVNGDPTALFTVHTGVTVFVGLVAAFGWCTRNVLRSQRKDLRRLERKIITPADVRVIIQEVFDEGQITGLATGLADLERGALRRPAAEN